ncbi:MAG: hypothetical protein M3N46_06855 [Actinomycetota bacterium]|nr:hypothetical protein [Actinomycetota bacterium]
MGIRADDVRFAERDFIGALGIAAAVGAMIGAITGGIIAGYSWLIGAAVGGMVGGFVALFAAGGAAIAHAVLRSRGTRRARAFVVGVSLGAAVPPLAAVALLNAGSLSSGLPEALPPTVVSVAVVFALTTIPTAVFVWLSFRRRAARPAVVPARDEQRIL